MYLLFVILGFLFGWKFCILYKFPNQKQEEEDGKV